MCYCVDLPCSWFQKSNSNLNCHFSLKMPPSQILIELAYSIFYTLLQAKTHPPAKLSGKCSFGC